MRTRNRATGSTRSTAVRSCRSRIARALAKANVAASICASNPAVLAPVNKRQILVRMLSNLKAIYLRGQAFEKARAGAGSADRAPCPNMRKSTGIAGWFICGR